MSKPRRDIQRVALAHHCRLACETVHPRFTHRGPRGWIVRLTVNSGYE
jgi:hypothetical protein